MRDVDVDEFRADPDKVWRLVDAGEVIVVMRNGQPLALLLPTGPADLEGALDEHRAARFGAVVDRMQAHARAQGLNAISDATIEAEIAAVRSARRPC